MNTMKETPLTMQDISWELLMEDLEENTPDEIKVHVSIILKALRMDEEQKCTHHWIETSLLKTEACLDRVWETLNSGYWKSVPVKYRYAYSLCSVLKAILLEKRSQVSQDSANVVHFKDIIHQIDKGILLGAPLPRQPSLLTTIASKVNACLVRLSPENCSSSNKLSKDSEINTAVFPGFLTVPRYSEPSMETFSRDIFLPKVPAILEGCMKHWRALDLWQDTAYLEKIVGSRTVPIEIGSRYTEEDWAQSLVTFSEFIKKHVTEKSEKIGYLAQHQLFEQVPELKNDFSIPEYCSFSDNEEEFELPDINAWFGPEGTVSPLHFDPKNNLLCQVFGYKRIVLYSPEDSENLYPYETRLLNNTAQVDPYRPDDEKWPRFRKAKGFMCYLRPGEMLFIPPKWWHHVVALSSSFSISLWWN